MTSSPGEEGDEAEANKYIQILSVSLGTCRLTMKLLTAALLLLFIAMCLASAEGKWVYSAYSHVNLFFGRLLFQRFAFASC